MTREIPPNQHEQYPLGARVLFLFDVDRFPHFIVPAGTPATVVGSEDSIIVVRVSDAAPSISGLTDDEEFDNLVQFMPAEEVVARDLKVVRRGLRQGDRVRFDRSVSRPGILVPAGSLGVVVNVGEWELRAEVDGAVVVFTHDDRDLEALELAGS